MTYPSPQPFRGDRLPRAKAMLEKKRIRLRYKVRSRNRNYSIGFGDMLRRLHYFGSPDRIWDLTKGKYWVISRESWPAHQCMHRRKKPNKALDRIMAADLPF